LDKREEEREREMAVALAKVTTDSKGFEDIESFWKASGFPSFYLFLSLSLSFSLNFLSISLDSPSHTQSFVV
jgi:hypothetical protein